MKNEEQYDVFISHSSKNRAEAESLVAGLEKRKLKCWIAPRDLMPGAEYGAEIIRGIKGSKALIVLLSVDAISSRAVRAEVERASSMDKLVIPIAIEEVTLTHGLEFFLSLSQRVDLFDGPKEAHIDRVADMINSGLAQPAQHRKRKTFTRLVYKVGGGVLTGIAILVVILGYFYWDAAKQERQIQQQLEQVTQQLVPKQATVLDDTKESELKPEFKIHWSGSTPSISFKKVAGVPPNSQLLSSTDGNNYVLGGPGDFSFDMKFFVKIRFGQETIGPFDFTEELHQAVRDSFAQSSIGSQITCSVRGCEIYREICGKLWDKFTLSGEARQDGETYYTLDCASKKPVTQKACVGVPNDMPALHPGTTLYGALHAQGMESYVFKIKTEYSARQFTRDNNGKSFFVELEPTSKRERAPFAVTWFLPLQPTNVNPFRIELGIGACEQGRLNIYDTAASLYYDTDGRGLIESGVRGFSIPQPLSDTVRLAVDAKNGERYGPYTYSFDVNKVVQARIDATDKPKLTCTYRNKPDGSTEWFCPWREPRVAPIGYDVFAWARVKEVRYGKSPDNLSDVVTIDLPISEVIKRSQIRGVFNLDLKPIIDIRPPKDWADLYFEMEYTDGTKTSVQRIQLKNIK